MLGYVLVTVIGYLMGSFPSGYLAARALKGVDPRQHGSGRTGGTNILRSAGKGAAFLTVIGDFFKGLLPVLFARWWLGTDAAAVLAGLAAVLGHNRSIFLRFGGGAGSMTNAGVVAALAPHALPFMVVAAFISARIWRMASVASMVTAATMATVLIASFLLSLSPVAYAAYGVLACVLIVFELRPNIERLRNGTERRVENY
jgi:glycerol-3-phosphate acyltransferase PlsY